MASTSTREALSDLFSEDQQTADKALSFIALLTCDSVTNRRFFTSDPRVISRVVTLFRAGNLNAVSVLAALAKVSATVQSQIAEADNGFAIPALVKELRTDLEIRSNETRVFDALAALASLAVNHTSNQVRIIGAGGLAQATVLLQKQADAMHRQVDKIKRGEERLHWAEFRYLVMGAATSLLRVLACGNADGQAAVVTGGAGIDMLLGILSMPSITNPAHSEHGMLGRIMDEWKSVVIQVVAQLMSHPDASAAVLKVSGASVSQLVQQASRSSAQAVTWLSLLSHTSTEMRDAIAKEGGVAVLLKELLSTAQGSEVGLCGFALSGLVDKNPNVQLEFTEQGGVGLLLSLVSSTDEFNFSRVQPLDSLARTSECHAKAIARAGGLPYLVAHLRYGPGNQIQQWTIPMLQRVLFTGHDKHDNAAQTMFRNMDGVVTLHKRLSGPVEYMELLQNLASQDRVVLAIPKLLEEENTRKCMEWMMPPIDYVEAFATVLRNDDPAKTEERTLAARALANLACNNPANRVLIANTGVLNALVRLLSSENDEATAAVAMAIRNLANDDVNRDAFGLLNVVPPLVKILKSDKGPKSKAAAASALGSLASHGHTANQQTIVKHDGIPALVELLRAATKPKPQETAVKTLWVLAKDSSVHRQAIVDAGGVSAVEDFIQNFQLEPEEMIYWATRLQDILSKSS